MSSHVRCTLIPRLEKFELGQQLLIVGVFFEMYLSSWAVLPRETIVQVMEKVFRERMTPTFARSPQTIDPSRGKLSQFHLDFGRGKIPNPHVFRARFASRMRRVPQS